MRISGKASGMVSRLHWVMRGGGEEGVLLARECSADTNGQRDREEDKLPASHLDTKAT